MNTNRTSSFAPIVAIALWIVVAVMLLMPTQAAARTFNSDIVRFPIGGDCHAAHGATGDTYKSHDDVTCGGVPGAAAPVVKDVEPRESNRDLYHVDPMTTITDDGDQSRESITGDDGSSGQDTDTNYVAPARQKKGKSNNGNHYGSDAPDQNENDIKNKHDGENTAAEHHDEPKEKKNK